MPLLVGAVRTIPLPLHFLGKVCDLDGKFLLRRIGEMSLNPLHFSVICVIINLSAKNKNGVEQLYKEISEMMKLNEIAVDGELIVSNNRHKNLITKARKNVKKSFDIIRQNLPIDITAYYLKEIIEELGKITGESVTEDVLNEIFSKFCLGK